MGIRRASFLSRPGADRWTYDIEADWDLLHTCNYRCTYCFVPAQLLGSKLAPVADIEHIAAFFDRSGLTWLLHCTGGEPFLYPRFVELCTLLTRRHVISINTNADLPRVKAFAEAVDPERVHYVHCGLHLPQRIERKREEQFVSNVLALRSAGFNAFVSCVMAPEIFTALPQIWDAYAARGLFIIPKALRGWYRGRTFPAAYTDEQRALFRAFSLRAEEAYRRQFADREAPTVNPLSDRGLHLEGFHDFRGQLCEAGRRFVRIHANGDIYRCGPVDLLGNIVEGRFNRWSAPSICQEWECPYFCQKYRVRGTPHPTVVDSLRRSSA